MLLLSVLALVPGLVAGLLSLVRRRVAEFVTSDANQVWPSVLGISETSCIRLLAFGDDWTEGVTRGQVLHPYATALDDHLHPQLPLGIHLEIEEQGKSGDTVLGGMKDRLQRTLDEHAAAGDPFNWVLLQGGINDLLNGDASQASEVLAGLDVLVQSCLAHGASVVLMTLLEVASAEPTVEAQRTALNAGLREYVTGRKWQKNAPELVADEDAAVAEIRLRGAAPTKAIAAELELTEPSAAGPAPGVVLCDLATYLPRSSLSDHVRKELWHDDTQQLTVDGHDAVGLLLSNTLVSQFKRQQLVAA